MLGSEAMLSGVSHTSFISAPQPCSSSVWTGYIITGVGIPQKRKVDFDLHWLVSATQELTMELDEKQDVFRSLQDTAELLSLENHPAKQTVEVTEGRIC